MRRHFFRTLLLCACSAIALLGPGQPAAASIIFWTSNDGIRRANSDGSMAQQVVSSTSLGDILYEPVSGKIYWTEVPALNQTVIKRAELDGSGAAEVLTLPRTLRQFAIDPSGGKFYWGENAVLYRGNFDGSDIEIVRSFSVEYEPTGIALDLSDGKAYWTHNFFGLLQRSNLDGTILQNLVGGLSGPGAIALDHALGKMYFGEGTTPRIANANLDGTQLETVVTTGDYPTDIALDVPAGKMYWSMGSFSGIIQRANLDGTAVETILTADYGIYSIAIAPGTIVPEPTTLTLAALGLAAGLLTFRRRHAR